MKAGGKQSSTGMAVRKRCGVCSRGVANPMPATPSRWPMRSEVCDGTVKAGAMVRRDSHSRCNLIIPHPLSHFFCIPVISCASHGREAASHLPEGRWRWLAAAGGIPSDVHPSGGGDVSREGGHRQPMAAVQCCLGLKGRIGLSPTK